MKFHIVKRDNCPLWKKCCFYLAAVVIALLLGAVLLIALGVDPVAYYTRMFTMGTIGNKIAYKVWINYLKEFVPLALTAVALSLAFKMRFWNIGGEGQFILGAIAAAFVAFQAGDQHIHNTECSAFGQHAGQHFGGIALSALAWADGIADMSGIFSEKIVEFMPQLNDTDHPAGLFVHINIL